MSQTDAAANTFSIANPIIIRYTVQSNLATKPEGHLKHLNNQEFRFNLKERNGQDKKYINLAEISSGFAQDGIMPALIMCH